MKPKVITIVGAGLAGLSTAISLSRRVGSKAEVYLFEDHDYIGEELSGDACSSVVLDIIRQRCYVEPHNKWTRSRFNKIMVHFPEGNKLGRERVDADIEGVMFDKTKVERDLAKVAKKLGCNIRIGHMFLDGKKTKYGFKTAFREKKTGRIEHHKTDAIVCADGYASKVVRSIGLMGKEFWDKIWWPSLDLGLQTRLRGNFKDIFNEKGIVIKFAENRPSEYFYVFPWNEEEANVGYVSTSRNAKTIDETLDHYLKLYGYDKYEVLQQKKGKFIPGQGPLFKPYWEGLTVVGDAGAQVEPSFRAGIRLGVEAGGIAGEVMAEASLANNFSEDKLREYHARLQEVNPSLNHVKELRETKEIIEKVCYRRNIQKSELTLMNMYFDVIRKYAW